MKKSFSILLMFFLLFATAGQSQTAQEYLERGISKFNLQDYGGAIADCNKAIELNPKIASVYCTRGHAKCSLQDYREAITDYNKAIEIDPKLASAYFGRGVVKIRIGQKDGGCLDLNKATELGFSEAKELIKQNCK